jgi:hypothetical protein
MKDPINKAIKDFLIVIDQDPYEPTLDTRALLSEETRKELEHWETLPKKEQRRLLKLRRYETERELNIPDRIEELWQKSQSINAISAALSHKGVIITFHKIRRVLIKRGYSIPEEQMGMTAVKEAVPIALKQNS